MENFGGEDFSIMYCMDKLLDILLDDKRYIEVEYFVF